MNAMTIKFSGTVKRLCRHTLLFCLIAGAGAVNAQQAVNVEELEKLLEQQKEALAEVEANRSATESQAQQARDALAEQEKDKAKIEEEFETLCKEQEVLKPGSFDECMASM